MTQHLHWNGDGNLTSYSEIIVSKQIFRDYKRLSKANASCDSLSYLPTLFHFLGKLTLIRLVRQPVLARFFAVIDKS